MSKGYQAMLYLKKKLIKKYVVLADPVDVVDSAHDERVLLPLSEDKVFNLI